MRLWTVHPKYLDAKGLVAAWREALLAQKVLAGQTKGYRAHPQLARFQTHRQPSAAIAAFLFAVADEAERRDYRFDRSKILLKKSRVTIRETSGQLIYEWEHLKRKLQKRAPKLYGDFSQIKLPEPHPLFRIVIGGIRDWEKIDARQKIFIGKKLFAIKSSRAL